MYKVTIEDESNSSSRIAKVTETNAYDAHKKALIDKCSSTEEITKIVDSATNNVVFTIEDGFIN